MAGCKFAIVTGLYVPVYNVCTCVCLRESLLCIMCRCLQLFCYLAVGYCLILWTDEDSVSVIPLSKIVSPPATEIKRDCACTVKGFESCPSRVLSIGEKREIESMEKEFIKNKDADGAKKNQKSAAENVVDSSSKRARQEGSESPPPPKKSRLFFRKSKLYMYMHTCSKTVCLKVWYTCTLVINCNACFLLTENTKKSKKQPTERKKAATKGKPKGSILAVGDLPSTEKCGSSQTNPPILAGSSSRREQSPMNSMSSFSSFL